jgi:hypothetical protein
MRVRVLRFARALVATALLLSTLLLAPSSALAVRTLGLSAGTFRFDVDAGQKASGEVTVMNDGTEPLKVMVYASDQRVDAKGSVSYQTPTRADLQSLSLPSSWTTIKMPTNSKALGNIPYLELKPKARVPVKFSITVPSSVPPGDHNVLIFFEAFETPESGQSTVAGRLGARVTLRVKGEFVRKLEVRPFNVPAYVIGGEVPFDFTVRNTGNLDQRVGARVLLLDRTGNEVQRKTVIDGLAIFADTNHEATGTLLADKMPVGPFQVRIDVSPVDDTGKATDSGANTITQSHEVWLIPYWLIVLVVVVVILIFVSIIWAIASASARRRASQESKTKVTNQEPTGGGRPFPDSEYEE